MIESVIIIAVCIFLVHYIQSIVFHMKEAKEYMEESYDWTFKVAAFIPFKNYQDAKMFQTKNRTYRMLYKAKDDFFRRGRK